MPKAPRSETRHAQTPPRPEPRPHSISAPGGTRTDPYYWLRDDDRNDPEVRAHLEAENRYFEAITANQAATRAQLYTEMRARLREDDASPPAFDNGYWYYSRYEQGRDYAIHARRAGTMDAPEAILLDGNARAEGQPYYQLGSLEISPDNRWLAWTEDTVGRRQYQLYLRDLETGECSAALASNIQPDLAWASDSRTLLYIQQDETTLLGSQVFALRRDAPEARPRLIYEEADDAFFMSVERSRSGRYLFIVLQSTETAEWRAARADGEALVFAPVIPRSAGHEYDIEDIDDTDILIRSNENAPNFRLLRAPMAVAADRASWREWLAHREDALVDSFEVFDDWLAVNERVDGLLRLRLMPWAGGEERVIVGDAAPSGIHLVGAAEPSSPSVRYVESRLTTPQTVYDHALSSGARTLVKQQPVEGDFDAANYRSDYRWITVRDGARVPLSLVHHRDTPLDGSAPLLLTGYGAYGLCLDPAFSSHRLSLLERGWIVAIAHVRGGEELGRAWYDAGRLHHKRNTFQDFMDVSDALAADGVCAADQIHATGGSAGGLLMGVIANEHAARYRSISAHVPFVDILTTMLDPSIPLTTNEYDEWGNPQREADYRVIADYSPYDHVRAQVYPAMLVTSGLWDSQVQYWEPTKWVAKLRDHQRGDAPILLHTEMEAGHGGRSGRFEQLHEYARDYAFVLHQAAKALADGDQ